MMNSCIIHIIRAHHGNHSTPNLKTSDAFPTPYNHTGKCQRLYRAVESQKVNKEN